MCTYTYFCIYYTTLYTIYYIQGLVLPKFILVIPKLRIACDHRYGYISLYIVFLFYIHIHVQTIAHIIYVYSYYIYTYYYTYYICIHTLYHITDNWK